jgi:hypothetical protein
MKQAWRNLMQIAKWQCLGAAAGWITAFCLFDAHQSAAFLFGSVVLISGTLISARIGLKPASSPEASVVRILVAVSWKWLWVFAGLVAAITKLSLPEIGLVAGVVCMQLVGIFAGMRAR